MIDRPKEACFLLSRFLKPVLIFVDPKDPRKRPKHEIKLVVQGAASRIQGFVGASLLQPLGDRFCIGQLKIMRVRSTGSNLLILKLELLLTNQEP